MDSMDTISYGEWSKLSDDEKGNYDTQFKQEANGNIWGTATKKGSGATEKAKEIADKTKKDIESNTNTITDSTSENIYKDAKARAGVYLPSKQKTYAKISDTDLLRNFKEEPGDTDNHYSMIVELNDRWNKIKDDSSKADPFRRMVLALGLNPKEIFGTDITNTKKEEPKPAASGRKDYVPPAKKVKDQNGGAAPTSAPGPKADENTKKLMDEGQSTKTLDEGVKAGAEQAENENSSDFDLNSPEMKKTFDESSKVGQDTSEDKMRGIIAAWREGYFGDKDSKKAKARRDYYIWDTIFNSVQNVGKDFAKVGGKDLGSETTSEWREQAKTEAENAISRKNKAAEQANTDFQDAIKKSTDNHIARTSTIEDWEAKGYLTNADNKLDSERKYYKVNDMMNYVKNWDGLSDDGKRWMSTAFTMAMNGDYDTGSRIIASTDPASYSYIIQSGTENLKSNKRDDARLDTSMHMAINSQLDKFAKENAAFAHTYDMESLRTSLANANDQAEKDRIYNTWAKEQDIENSREDRALRRELGIADLAIGTGETVLETVTGAKK